jgi:DNA-binding beta-propeller fold protein YncE
MKKTVLSSALALAAASFAATADDFTLGFTKLWTHGHTSTGQVSEIPGFDKQTNTIWVAGVVGVDVLNAADGSLLQHIDLSAYGGVNSVAVRNGFAAVAVEAAGDRRNPGSVLLFNTKKRALRSGVNQITVGALPDMLTFTPDGSKLLVANEGTPNAVADQPYTPTNDPAGSVTVIDVATRSVLATAGFGGVPQVGSNLRTNTGMDFEPEYIAVGKDGTHAFVTLQEANAVAVLDLGLNAFTQVIGLGAKDFNQTGNEIDPKDNDGVVAFGLHAAKGLYMPDSVAAYEVNDETYIVMANEGDFREDNVDRVAASTFGAVAPLDRLRVIATDSSAGNLFAAGARSFSIRDKDGNLVYDSGSLLDQQAHARGLYDNGRSRDKGVEPEGVALLKISNRTFAFVGLERALQAAVAVFDVTDPAAAQFIDMIVTPGDLAPEGLVAYKYQGQYFLAISNEAIATAAGSTTSNTSLYRLNIVPVAP